MLHQIAFSFLYNCIVVLAEFWNKVRREKWRLFMDLSLYFAHIGYINYIEKVIKISV